MSKTEVYARLTSIFADLFPDRAIHLNPRLSITQVQGWDSSQHMNLILEVETAFAIRLAVEESESIETLGDLVELITAKTS